MNPMTRSGAPRIFLIDSNLLDCQSMSNSLLQAGYQVDFATDGWVGLTRVLEFPPQCLIISAILPGISGYAICRQVRAIAALQTLPIIVVDIGNTLLKQKYSLKVGASSYLGRPFSEDALLLAVRELLPMFSPMTVSQPLLPVKPPSPLSEFSLSQDESALIPYRPGEGDIMLRNNPLARSSIMADRQLRHLSMLIDGERNIQELVGLMRLDLQSTLKLLKMLWLQRHIAFYDKKRRPLREIPLFDRLK